MDGSRAAKGAELLDDKVPGWAEKIGLATLMMWSCSWCVLGQLFNDYGGGMKQLGLTAQEALEYGFCPIGSEFDPYNHDADMLRLEWQDEIARRQK